MNKFIKYTLITALVLFLVLSAFVGGFAVGQTVPLSALVPGLSMPSIAPRAVATPQAAAEATPQELQELFAPFWEAWKLVHEQYVDQPVDDTALMRGAIRGMLGALGDDHTSYMDPEEYKDANASLAGNYEGIGAYVDTTGDYLTIISPIKGSPAEAAGLRAGDKIIAIDGEDVSGINPELVRKRVLGPAGTTVTLTILREGEEKPFDVAITRAKIVVASVEYEMKGEIAYVKLNTFGETTGRELRDALKELMAQKPKGLILDLRNNGGGYLRTAVEVLSQFLKQGEVALYEQYGDGRRDTFNTLGGGLATDIPMVVIINEGSASASEIVAGALQDYGRATLVGVKSYGKGSVQNWIPLNGEQGAVRITVAKWLTPKERTIHKTGLTPDVIVELTKEDRDAKRDPQLDKALELLSRP
ncbi:MAG: S41 family peptidase [Anaerolineales bacterium]|nr:S41 family peptidase [Anaerolineales bacterium]MCX7755322.1 S41 family peptidase [Anaerolineales bacterium]MDW8279321.1 S41 family peptidase [Anaerolineales bacterium]